MPPKPKQVFLVLAGDLPVAAFRDAPAAHEHAASLNAERSSIDYSVVPVRFYEYKVVKGLKESGE